MNKKYREKKHFSPAAMDAMYSYSWPAIFGIGLADVLILQPGQLRFQVDVLPGKFHPLPLRPMVAGDGFSPMGSPLLL